MKKLLYLLFAICLIGCSDDDDSSQKFRNIYKDTFWQAGSGGLMTFSPDKLFYNYDAEDGECYYWEEGDYNNVDYDGCDYEKVTLVIIEEDSDTFVFRQITSDGLVNYGNNVGSICSGDEISITFQVLNENAISFTYSDNEGYTESFTLVKANNSFSANDCLNSTLNGILF
jgi:hypothetical protein